ncbi:SMI1/KNR4 family protein [Kitasatospora sp. NPDC056783]|uniref:SMI1/KNR4 family protein n=1 Tax=Kitasatospora sp. NPDC056783 TaxID=3345943 RepID=UPI00369CC018
MDSRIPRVRRKLAAAPFQPLRSHSFGEETHRFRLGPRLTEARITAIESEHAVALPGPYRQFLLHIGGSGAGPFYGLKPLEKCALLVMQPSSAPGTPRGFDEAGTAEEGDLFLHIAEMGCTDVCVLALTGPLVGRVVIGNSDGHWGPDVSSASDFLAWYERWLDHMTAGLDNRALELTSPHLRSHPNRHRLAPKM